MHCRPDQLALAALSEPLPARDAEHLAGCPRCRDEVASLRRAVDAVRVPRPEDDVPPVAPPPQVWAAIAAATGVSAAPRPEAVEAAAAPAPPPLPRPRLAPVPSGPPVPGNPVPATAVPSAPVSSTPGAPGPAGAPPALPARRTSRPRRWAVAGAVAAGLAVGVAGTVLAVSRSGDGPVPTPGADPVLSATALSPLDDRDASGEATLVDRDGVRTLVVDLDAPPAGDGYYEVWLLSPGADELVALGVLDGATADLDLPAGLDLADYPLVDVSLEPFDGDPAHSAVSVARGSLT